jgi:hypothetical protein
MGVLPTVVGWYRIWTLLSFVAPLAEYDWTLKLLGFGWLDIGFSKVELQAKRFLCEYDLTFSDKQSPDIFSIV